MLSEHIASNVYLEFTEQSDRWDFTPYWQGEPMKDFVPETCYCRALYTFCIGSKRFLMKIDKSQAFLQCADELNIWNILEKQYKRYFVPIMYGNDGRDGSPPFVIMPFVPNLAIDGEGYDCPYKEQQCIINEIASEYRLRDLTFNKNWYNHNGRPLIVDYGCKR